MDCIHGQSLILCPMKSATTSAAALHLGTMILFLQKRSNQTMKPTQPLCCKLSMMRMLIIKVLGGLSLSR
jgi:hypothetical protein